MHTKYRSYGHFVNGASDDANNSTRIEVRNPASGELVAIVREGSAADVNDAVMAARAAFDGWSIISQRERSDMLRRMAALVRDKAKELVEIEVSEVGRPIAEISNIDIPEAADCFEFYASAARLMRGSTIPLATPYHDFTWPEPIGVVGQILPWNFPLNIAAWKIAPALATGNCVVVKPSDLTPSSTIELAKIATEAGLPDGVLNVVTGYESAGAAVVEHPEVDMIAFTGSQTTGFKVAEAAGRSGKKVSLELGGKSAHILFADCDLDAAVPSALEGGFFAQGQNCCAGSRLLVDKAIFNRVAEKLAHMASRLVIGSPNAPATQVGCLISMKQYERVKSFIDEAKERGVSVIGEQQIAEQFNGRPFLSPTIVMNPPLQSRIVQEEIFGPVLTISSFEHDEEAVQYANGTRYDLAAAVWTRDVSRAHRIARRLRAGTVWINTYNRVFNDAPFGGHRWSGYGRDLGTEALHEYTRVKNVCICTEPGSDKWFNINS